MFVSNVGKLKPLQILDFLPQRHGQKRPNSVHICHLIIKVKEPSSCPKIANESRMLLTCKRDKIASYLLG